MKRREFITLLGGAAAAGPFAAGVQQGERMRRIGVLVPQDQDSPVAGSDCSIVAGTAATGLDRAQRAN